MPEPLHDSDLKTVLVCFCGASFSNLMNMNLSTTYSQVPYNSGGWNSRGVGNFSIY